ncbi:hypothetical protein BH10ACI3_BH10ACI3_18780 [soil metagenome]
MNTNRTKLIAIISFALPVLFVCLFNVASVKVAANNVDDPATVYKAKCAMCHTATASKFYDPAKTEAEHVQIILQGKKGEKPPFMPGFEAKGMTAADATALAQYMKTLKPAAN